MSCFFFFQAKDGIRDLVRSRGLGDVYKRQLQGMQILFVPFLTDTQNAYSRVRHCSQARAIENECFVAIAGSVGNLPRVSNMDIQYAQSAVFTPCDFAFPSTGIKSEATANTEMVLVVDVDLSLLKDLHHRGSVRNLNCLLYTSPSPRDRTRSRMPSSA